MVVHIDRMTMSGIRRDTEGGLTPKRDSSEPQKVYIDALNVVLTGDDGKGGLHGLIKDFFSPEESGAFVAMVRRKLPKLLAGLTGRKATQQSAESGSVPGLGKEETDLVEKRRSFIASRIIRVVDDFLDDIIWPRISEYQRRPGYKPEELRTRVEDFLKEVLKFAQEHEPAMPDAIIALWTIEIDISSETDSGRVREKFKQQCVRYLLHKAFDLHYQEALESGRDIMTPEDLEDHDEASFLRYAWLCVADLSRDFLPKSVREDEDFNVARLMKDHQVDPWPLIAYVQTIIERLRTNREVKAYGDVSKEQMERECTTFIERLQSLANKRTER